MKKIPYKEFRSILFFVLLFMFVFAIFLKGCSGSVSVDTNKKGAYLVEVTNYSSEVTRKFYSTNHPDRYAGFMRINVIEDNKQIIYYFSTCENEFKVTEL